MILVDTSVWIEHLRKGHSHLQHLLLEGDVLCHRMVIGELACGNLRNRMEVIDLLTALPAVQETSFDEYLYFIDLYQLWAKGIGFVDIHLLASAKLAGAGLWTLDKRLADTAAELGLEYKI